MYDYERLDGFSQDFADVFFRVYPDWRKYARVDQDNSLRIKKGNLIISTALREVTVFKGDNHWHFDRAFGPKERNFAHFFKWMNARLGKSK